MTDDLPTSDVLTPVSFPLTISYTIPPSISPPIPPIIEPIIGPPKGTSAGILPIKAPTNPPSIPPIALYPALSGISPNKYMSSNNPIKSPRNGTSPMVSPTAFLNIPFAPCVKPLNGPLVITLAILSVCLVAKSTIV